MVIPLLIVHVVCCNSSLRAERMSKASLSPYAPYTFCVNLIKVRYSSSYFALLSGSSRFARAAAKPWNLSRRL